MCSCVVRVTVCSRLQLGKRAIEKTAVNPVREPDGPARVRFSRLVTPNYFSVPFVWTYIYIYTRRCVRVYVTSLFFINLSAAILREILIASNVRKSLYYIMLLVFGPLRVIYASEFLV